MPSVYTQENELLSNLSMDIRELIKLSTPSIASSHTILERNSLAYIAGYMEKKVSRKVCRICQDSLSGELTDMPADYKFIQAKGHKDVKHGLRVPSPALFKSVCDMHASYIDCIEGLIHSNHVKLDLFDKCSKLFLLPGMCNKCNTSKIAVHLFINVMLHHSIKVFNESLQSSKSRKNRKLYKVTHR